MAPQQEMTSARFVRMLSENGITHVWIIQNKPPKGFRPGNDPPIKPNVKFISRQEDCFVLPPPFLAEFTGNGPYAGLGRKINELKNTIYDLDALKKALSAKWGEVGKE